jgi:hypothetical protein
MIPTFVDTSETSLYPILKIRNDRPRSRQARQASLGGPAIQATRSGSGNIRLIG